MPPTRLDTMVPHDIHVLYFVPNRALSRLEEPWSRAAAFDDQGEIAAFRRDSNRCEWRQHWIATG
jgi:hypothetical protein